MQYLKYKPNRLWLMDTASPFTDISGYATNATLTGSIVKGITLSRYAAYSLVVNSTNYVTFPQNVYISGRETQAFSLVASIFLPDTGSFLNQQILSNSGRTDGLAINGNVLTFSTAYSVQGSAVCSYIIPVGQQLDVVGIHTPSKNLLFVNGELVDEEDISQAQQADVYAITDGNLYSGKLVAQNLLINTVATFPRALNPDEVLAMYNVNHSISTIDPYTAYVGELIDVSIDTRTPYLNASWNTEEDWESAESTSTFVDDDSILRPESTDGLTMNGIWQDSISLYNGESISPLDSLNMYWYGTNVLVEASVDGTAWETVQRGVNLMSIPSGFDPTNKALSIRATFTAGQTDAYLENLQVRAYLTNTAQQPNGRLITYTNPLVTFDDQAPVKLLDNWGTDILGGSLTIGTDTSTLPLTAKTVEVWIKQTGTSAPTISSNITTGSTVYTNGVTGSTIRRGEWNLQHYTNASGIIGNMVFSGNVQIGRVVVYDTALTSTQISNLYRNYTGTGIGNRSSGGAVTIAEHSPPANIYAHDWATSS